MTKKADLFRTLTKRWLTPLDAVSACGIFSLSQRCGEWRRDPVLQAAGVIVLDKWVALPSGSRVKAYRIVRPTSWTA
jgi:hypothetical protein